MARRKKEPESVHRGAIAAAAERLFMQKGIDQTTMDDITGQAGYSKATLYVYFKNKEEIVHTLEMESMTRLYQCIHQAAAQEGRTWEGYEAICWAVEGYQEEAPFYFSLAVGSIRVEVEAPDCTEVERKTYEVGEQINRELALFLQKGIEAGELRAGLEILPTVFLFWASLSGLVAMAQAKQAYIERTMGMTRRQFLSSGFATLYRAIAKEGAE